VWSENPAHPIGEKVQFPPDDPRLPAIDTQLDDCPDLEKSGIQFSSVMLVTGKRGILSKMGKLDKFMFDNFKLTVP